VVDSIVSDHDALHVVEMAWQRLLVARISAYMNL
jgi:hypothetical protein